jgi:glycosyltransferase involved in cell wall biosynthesis
MRTQKLGPITIFTPSFADENNTNAQNLTVKEIVARLPPELFRVIMITAGNPDPRIASRGNTQVMRWTAHGNSLKLIKKIILSRPDIYFFPRYGLLDRAFFNARKYLRLNTALISYIVMTMADETARKLARLSIVAADRLCTNSRYVARTVYQYFGMDSEIVYDGVDRRFFFEDDCRNTSRELVVLYAGSFQPRKRVDLVIQQAIRWPTVQFRLAGQGETQQFCRALCERHGCKNVTFLGHLDARQLGEKMRNSDLFLFPSVVEGHPQVLLQAAACGMPAIAMNCYEPDYVVNGQTGFLVDSDAELATCLDLLIANPELRQSMSAAAAHHSQAFNWDRIAEKWADIFVQVAETRLKKWSPRVLPA